MQPRRETQTCHYRYDALDRLIAHSPPSAPEHQRFYCKSRLATEIQGAMRYSIVQHGDQLLAQRQGEGDALDATLLVTDQQRSVLYALEAKHSQQPIAYLPYGQRNVENGLLSLLGFNGERLDPVTGHYLLGNGYRAFNPVLMRFNSPDSWSPFGEGGLNPYMYCLGDPVNQDDSNGHVSLRMIVKLAAWRDRAIARAATTRQLKKLTELSSTTSPMPFPLNALEQLQAAKNSSISLKRISLQKVKSLGITERDAPIPQAFTDAKSAVANIETTLHETREQYVTEQLERSFVRYGRLGIAGRAELGGISELELGSASGLPPLSPTSQKLFFGKLDKVMDAAIANLRRT